MSMEFQKILQIKIAMQFLILSYFQLALNALFDE